MNKRLLLLGETCNDVYLHTKHKRNSPENPLIPVLTVHRKDVKLGMAAKVGKMFDKLEVDYALITMPSGITKTRVIKDNESICRIDEDELYVDEDLLLKNLNNELKKVDVVVISDYGKGLLTSKVIDVLNESSKRIYLDPHPDNHIGQYKNLFCVKLNQQELYQFTKTTDLRQACDMLTKKCSIEYLFVTLGKDGIYYYNKNGHTEHEESQVTILKDVAGAGDVVMAVLVKNIENGMNIKEAMRDSMSVVASYIAGSIDL